MISKKLRFEVFKRDGFTCQYCGKKTPEVVLEVDHIVSVNDGGQDDLTNLVTSCFDCNRGKGKISLDEIPTQEEDLHEKTIILLERERQIKEYNEVLKKVREREDEDLKELANFWYKNCYQSTYAYKEAYIRPYLKIFSKEKIKDAMELASSRNLEDTGDYKSNIVFRYLCGILNNWRKQEEI